MIEAVIWDFGGVVTTSPFEAFARFESEHCLPADIIRRTNAANHLENAWAKFERAEFAIAVGDSATRNGGGVATGKVPLQDGLHYEQSAG